MIDDVGAACLVVCIQDDMIDDVGAAYLFVCIQDDMIDDGWCCIFGCMYSG